VANDIKQKIVLDGEKEYKQALKDAQRELKTLRSELKAETAELGKNATEQEKNQVKIKNLQKQIQEQEKIVKTYTEALEEVRKKYGDNQDEIAKWEVKLNDARTALANMKSGLEDAGQGFQKLAGDAQMGTVAANSFAQAFEGLGSLGDSVSGAVEGLFTGIIDTAKEAVGELWDLITDTAAKANNWTDLANYFGSTAEQVQLFSRAIESVDEGKFSDFTTLLSQLSFGGKNKKIAEIFGISDANYTNNVEYTMAVLDAMSKAYKEWGTGGKWDNAMSEIFGGKKSATVSWFVTNLDTITGKMAELQENGGYLMDAKTLGTMNDVYIQLQSIEEKWDMLQGKFAGGFGTITLDIMTNVSGALDALARFFDAKTPKEREQALADLRTNLEEAFRTLAEAIRAGVKALDEVAEELKSSEDPIVSTIGNILGGLADALKWLTKDNAQNAKDALLILAGVWTGGKVLSMVSTIGQLAGHIATIKMANGFGGLASMLNGGGLGSVAGAAGGVTSLGSTITSAVSAAAGPFVSALAGITMSVGLVALAVPIIDTLWKMFRGEDPLGTNKDLNKPGEFMENASDEVKELADTIQEQTPAELKKSTINRPLWMTLNSLNGNGATEIQAYEEPGLFSGFTAAQRTAAEQYYDTLWSGAGDDTVAAALVRLDETLGDGGALSDLVFEIDEMMRQNQLNDQENPLDLPADWWKKGSDENGVTSADIQSLNEMPAAVAAAVRGVAGSIIFKMDSEVVARLVAPEVSALIAADID